MKSILVRIVDSSGTPQPDKEVTVWQSGFFGNWLDRKRTDPTGAAEFLLDINDGARIDVHVAGKVVAQGERPQASLRFVV